MKPSIQKYDIIVIGGGAAGLLCAITAAKRGRNVLILERANKIGKKILMSGGGKCNFTNLYVTSDNFTSRNPHFCKSALSQYTPEDFIKMVDEAKIDYEIRKNDQFFCVHTSKDILNMLIHLCEKSDIKIMTHANITDIEYCKNNSRYLLACDTDNGNKHFSCSSIVVASGGLSIPSLGGSGYAYDVARQFQIPLIETRAGLAPFTFSDYLKPICERLSGLSLPIEIECNGKAFLDDMLFTHRGLSGPSVLQISSYWNLGDTISVNLLPDMSMTKDLIDEKVNNRNILLRTYLSRFIPKALVKELELLLWKEQSELTLDQWSNKQLEDIGNIINHWVLKPSGTEGYRTAEVTLGGVSTDYISSKTMEVKGQSGLYFIGEALDVSGQLGGFNFQWAWASGYCAGLFA